MFVTLHRGGRRNGALLCIQRVAGSTPALSTIVNGPMPSCYGRTLSRLLVFALVAVSTRAFANDAGPPDAPAAPAAPAGRRDDARPLRGVGRRPDQRPGTAAAAQAPSPQAPTDRRQRRSRDAGRDHRGGGRRRNRHGRLRGSGGRRVGRHAPADGGRRRRPPRGAGNRRSRGLRAAAAEAKTSKETAAGRSEARIWACCSLACDGRLAGLVVHDRAGGTVSAVVLLGGYALGTAAGATIGWNRSKRPLRPDLELQPITRAGPPPAAMAAWTEPLVRPSARNSIGAPQLAVPLLAFAF